MIYFSNHYNIILNNSHHTYEYKWDDIGLVDIKRFIQDYHKRRKQQVCIHELGIDGMRFDFLSLNPYKHYVRILEYKVNVPDFKGDDKHLGYMDYCNTLAFVTPFGMVGVDDLKHEHTGLLQIFRWKRRNARINRWNLGAIWVKRPSGRRLPRITYYRIMEMMMARLVQGRKGDFF